MSVAADQFLTIVSGLPRSGTSMMMRMLEAGGMPVMVDHIRVPDEDNPGGYYEFEPVKKTKDDASWLAGSEGKAVKMVYRLLYDLPSDRSYRVLFMRRQLEEVLASQRVMLERHGAGDQVTDTQMKQMFLAEIEQFYQWVSKQPGLQLIDVSYNAVQENPRRELLRIQDFLGGHLDVEAMQGVVDKALYRNRA